MLVSLHILLGYQLLYGFFLASKAGMSLSSPAVSVLNLQTIESVSFHTFELLILIYLTNQAFTSQLLNFLDCFEYEGNLLKMDAAKKLIL